MPEFREQHPQKPLGIAERTVAGWSNIEIQESAGSDGSLTKVCRTEQHEAALLYRDNHLARATIRETAAKSPLTILEEDYDPAGDLRKQTRRWHSLGHRQEPVTVIQRSEFDEQGKPSGLDFTIRDATTNQALYYSDELKLYLTFGDRAEAITESMLGSSPYDPYESDQNMALIRAQTMDRWKKEQFDE